MNYEKDQYCSSKPNLDIKHLHFFLNENPMPSYERCPKYIDYQRTVKTELDCVKLLEI